MTNRSVQRAACAFLLAMLLATGARAQIISIESITPAQFDLGVIVSPTSGDTVFRLGASDGAVTKVSGQGSRQGSGMARALVTLTCTGDDGCEAAEAIVTIAAAGGSVGRAGALTAFTVAAGPNPPIMSPADGVDIITFRVSGIARDQTRNFYIGADFTISSGADTGEASSGYIVSVPSSSRSGTISATTWRPISVTNLADLSFGRIIRPASGSGTVVIDAASGRSVTSGVIALSSPAPSIAEFLVSGEGGQSFAIDIPTSFTLTGTGENLTVTTSNNADATPVLGSSAGSGGDYQFKVGGSLSISDATAAGHYSGSFQVIVLYN